MSGEAGVVSVSLAVPVPNEKKENVRGGWL